MKNALAIAAVTILLPAPLRAADPEIIGSVQYSNQVHRALMLLAARDTNAYAIVTNYVGRIQQGDHSGMWAYKVPPTYEMATNTAYFSITWCAATIAHDSFHSKLYLDYKKSHAGDVPDNIWIGQAAEQKCMQHQLAVMKRIGATQWEIDWAKKQADGHYVQDPDNEYNRRKW